MGFIGSRHIGDLLRTRLVGLAYPRWYPDLVAGSALVLVVVVMKLVFPGLPYWLFVLPLVLLLVLTFYQLGLQFARTIKRVNDCLGISIFHVPDQTGTVPSHNAPGPAKTPVVAPVTGKLAGN
jgi:hypothetical protein